MFREISVYNNLRKSSFKVQLQILYAFLKTTFSGITIASALETTQRFGRLKLLPLPNVLMSSFTSNDSPYRLVNTYKYHQRISTHALVTKSS